MDLGAHPSLEGGEGKCTAISVMLHWYSLTHTHMPQAPGIPGATLSFNNQDSSLRLYCSILKILPHKHHRFPKDLLSVVSVAAAMVTAVPWSLTILSALETTHGPPSPLMALPLLPGSPCLRD